MRLRLHVPIEEIGKLRHGMLSLACMWPSGDLNQGCLASESGFITTTFFCLQDPGLQHPPSPQSSPWWPGRSSLLRTQVGSCPQCPARASSPLTPGAEQPCSSVTAQGIPLQTCDL